MVRADGWKLSVVSGTQDSPESGMVVVSTVFGAAHLAGFCLQSELELGGCGGRGGPGYIPA